MTLKGTKSRLMVSTCLDNFDTKRSFRRLNDLYPSKVIQLDEISGLAKSNFFRFNEIKKTDHLRLDLVEKLCNVIMIIFNSDD